jgi:hypothetical protein
MPSDGGVCIVHGSKDYDDFQSDDDGSHGNVCNENDDEALKNDVVGDEVHGALHEQNNDICKEFRKVSIREGPDCNNPQQSNENFDHVIAL